MVETQSEACEWRAEDDENMLGTFSSACGAVWTFMEGGPTDNGVKFCMCCGKPAKEIITEPS